MKRYGIAAVFAVFIVLTIGIYYVQASMDRLPQYRLVTITGDSREGDGLVLAARHVEPPYVEMVEISASGSRYDSKLSVVERLRKRGKRGIPSIDRLVREYPNFMRGDETADYQDDETVIRVNPVLRFPDAGSGILTGFQFERLDKQTKRERAFRIDLPENLAIIGINLLDVQRFGSAIKVAAECELDGRPGMPEVRVYEFDLSEEKLTGFTALDLGEQTPAGQDRLLSTIQTFDWTLPSEYLTFEVSVRKIIAADEDPIDQHAGNKSVVSADRLELAEQKLAIYHYPTGNVRWISLPVAQEGQRLIYNIGHHVALLNMTDTAVEINTYSIAEARMIYGGRLTVQDLQADRIEEAEIGPDRFYLALRKEDQPVFAAIDPVNGKAVWRGAVTLDEKDEARKKEWLSRIGIYSIYREDPLA